MAAKAPLKAIATVILIDIILILNNHYSTVNQRAIAMVKQWRHWKPLQRWSNGSIGSHCNGYLPSPGYISPSKTTFPTAATAIATDRCKITTAVATVILSDIRRLLSNNNSKVMQWLNWKPLQWLNTLSLLYFTFRNRFRIGCNGHCNWNQPRRWKPMQWLITFSFYISPSKTAFAMAPNVIATARCKITTVVATVNQPLHWKPLQRWSNGYLLSPGYISPSKTDFAIAATAPLEALATAKYPVLAIFHPQ